MQRRAAAVGAAFFLLVAAGSYAVIAASEAPAVRFEDPEYVLSAGDEFEAGGETYTLSELTVEEESGGAHGGGGGVTRSGTVSWVNESARYTETWADGDEVTVDNTTVVVDIPNESDPAAVELREPVNRTAVLAADPDAEDETVTRDGEEFVVVRRNGSLTLVSAAEYFPEPPTTRYAEGDRLTVEGTEATVEAVTAEEVRLAWTAPRENTAEFGADANVTLGDTTYLAHFRDDETVVLTTDFAAYRAQTAAVDTYHQRKNGLWGIAILSGTTLVLLVGMAYLPSRY